MFVKWTFFVYDAASEQMQHTNLHEPLKYEELAMQIFKVLFEEVPEPIIKHDLHQNTESLLLWHLKKKHRFSNQCLMAFSDLNDTVSDEAKY